jgi:hypothetical protein
MEQASNNKRISFEEYINKYLMMARWSLLLNIFQSILAADDELRKCGMYRCLQRSYDWTFEADVGSKG